VEYNVDKVFRDLGEGDIRSPNERIDKKWGKTEIKPQSVVKFTKPTN
jgi:hypothetical protein